MNGFLADIESFHKYIAISEQQEPNNDKLVMTFTVAALFHNCCTFLYGGKVSKKFDCNCPELSDYLNCHDVMDKTHEISFDDIIRTFQLDNDRLALINNEESAQEIALNNSLIVGIGIIHKEDRF